jgi:hypothetical protein
LLSRSGTGRPLRGNARGRDVGVREEPDRRVKGVDRPAGGLDSERVEPFVEISGPFAAKCPR